MSKDDPAKDVIYERADVAFKKLEPHDGDIVLVTFPSDIDMKQIQAFAHYMEAAVPDGITVFCTHDNVDMKVLPKEQLNALGWYNFNSGSSELLN